MGLHYWNPLNYKKDFEFPLFLRPEEKKKREADPFWILHRKYLNCEFGERNFRRSWNNGEKISSDSVWNHP